MTRGHILPGCFDWSWSYGGDPQSAAARTPHNSPPHEHGGLNSPLELSNFDITIFGEGHIFVESATCF